MKNRKLYKVLLVILAFVVCGVIYTLVKDDDSPQLTVPETESIASESGVSAETHTESETAEICVYVCGAVNAPGVYYMEAGSRAHEAVEAAGGLREDAYADSVNLAAVLEDGQQLYIPSMQDLSEGTATVQTGAADDGMVNINTATVDELMTLSGIGQTRAEAIIEYRENNGAFSAPEDLMNVSGIGESTFENIKDKIKV